MRRAVAPHPVVVLAGALAALVSVTTIAVLLGFRPEAALDGNNALGRVHYVLVLAAIGAVLAWSWRSGLDATVVLGVLSLGAWLLTRSPTGTASLTGLNVPLTVFCVLVLHVGGVEFAVRNPATVRQVLTRRAVRWGTVAGVAHVIVVVLVRSLLDFQSIALDASAFETPTNVVVAVWSVGGLFLAGAVVGVLAARYRIALPALAVAALLGAVTLATLDAVPESGPNPARVGYLLTLYAWGWYVPLVLAVGAGYAEYQVRDAVCGTGRGV
ncbi:MAG: hypothetical protein ABEH83_08230 [Halobacterium sp.]